MSRIITVFLAWNFFLIMFLIVGSSNDRIFIDTFIRDSFRDSHDASCVSFC